MPLVEVVGGVAAPRGRVTEERYGELRDETLDVIAPAAVGERRLPIVHIHGGGWVTGSKGSAFSPTSGRTTERLSDRPR